MDDLLGVGASAATGGLFGVVGAAIGRVAGVFERREAFRHERARWQHEARLRELDLKLATSERDHELALAAARGSYEGLTASIAADAASAGASYRWVEAVRALVRPVLTPMLWLLYLVVFFRIAQGDVARHAPGESPADLLDYFVTNVGFAATAATLWWFGDRAPRPRDGEPPRPQ